MPGMAGNENPLAAKSKMTGEPAQARSCAWASILHVAMRAIAPHLRSRSPATISRTSSSNVTLCRQPSFCAPCWGRRAGIDLGRPEIARIDLDQHAAVARIDAFLLDAGAAPFDLPADMGERLLDEFAHRMLLAGREHKIVGLVLLQHQPHAFDVVARMAPVAPGIEIAEIELVLQAELDRRDRAA